ncbi:MAG: hypothetical protein KAS66_08080 [Candidatus Omnitrophica bacterium]|nr:hypothetical protein [Candidatus Omnitrophota bacterium]
MPELPEEIPAVVITTEYRVTNGTLTKEDTPDVPVKISKSWNIEHELKQIAKIDNAISLWQAKRKVHQDIVDKYNEEKPVEEPEEMPEV